jgi:uncharacterized protein
VIGLGVVLALVLLPVLALWLWQRRIVFAADSGDPGPAADWLPGSRDVALHTADGIELTAWYLPATAGCDVSVLVVPGNGGNRAGRADLAGRLHDRGYGVLLLDYRGYGGNPGSPTEDGVLLDGRAALAFLQDTVPDHRLVYFGESLGGAIATRLAITDPPAALVLRSPFVDLASAASVQFPWLPVRWMLWDELPVRDLIGQVPSPVAVIYGDADSVIPPAQSAEVAAAAGVPPVVVPGADHNDPALVSGPQVIGAVAAGVSC